MDKGSVDPRTLAGDPIAFAAERKRARKSRRTEAELIEAIREDEAATGRTMTPRERESFARGFFAPEYVRDIEFQVLMGIMAREAAEEDEEAEEA